MKIDAVQFGGATFLERRYMSKLSEADRSEKLVQLILIQTETYRASVNADQRLWDGIAGLIELLNTKRIAIADPNSSGHIWSRISLLDYFSDQFDRILVDLIPTDSLVWSEMSRLGTAFPIKSHLYKDSLCSLADNLWVTSKTLFRVYDEKLDDWNSITRVSETLRVVALLIYSIMEILPHDSVEWCELCFRRIPSGGKYCSVHTLAGNKNDTVYRKAKKIRDRIPSEIIVVWGWYKSLRRIRGDARIFTPTPKFVEGQLQKTSSSFTELSQEEKLASCTLEMPWVDIASYWDDLLKNKYKLCHAKLRECAIEHTSWESYARHILKAINDEYETTDNPFWILNIISCGEEWLQAENEFKDRRLTNSEREIVDLFNSGIQNPNEIARKIGVSRQYVHRVIKLNSL